MAIEDDDERARERLRDLGLLHLADQPEVVRREIDKMLAARDAKVAAYEAERALARGLPPPVDPKAPVAPPPRITTRQVSQPKAEPPPKRPSLLLHLSLTSGPCGKCRHANQRTRDFEEGLVYCAMAEGRKYKAHLCDEKTKAPKTIPVGPESSWDSYFYYEPYDGKNGTYGVDANYRALADDADNKLQDFQRAHLKSI